MRSLVAFVVGLLFVGMYGCGKYNQFIALDETVNQKLGNVNTALQRRHDLIPNLVATVQGYAKHESGVFTEVAAARSRVGQFTITPELLNNPQQLAAFQKAQGELSSALTRLMAVSENYPQLKADRSFLDLQSQLEGTENRIKVERDNYNQTVKDYNIAISQFPGFMFAGGRTKKDEFKLLTADAAQAPTVQF